MPYRKLLILAASPKMIGKSFDRKPAIETFDGEIYKQVRKYICPQIATCPDPDIAGNLEKNEYFNVLVVHFLRGLITGETDVDVNGFSPELTRLRAERMRVVCYSQWHWIKKRIKYDSVVINATANHRQILSQCKFDSHPTVYRSEDRETRLNLLDNWLNW